MSWAPCCLPHTAGVLIHAATHHEIFSRLFHSISLLLTLISTWEGNCKHLTGWLGTEDVTFQQRLEEERQQATGLLREGVRWLRELAAQGPCKDQQGGQKEKGGKGSSDFYPKREGFEKERHSPTHLYHFGLCVDYQGKTQSRKIDKEGKRKHPHLCKLLLFKVAQMVQNWCPSSR